MTVREQQQVRLTQFGRPDQLPSRQGMARRTGQEEGLVEERPGRQVFVDDGQDDKRRVQPVGLESIQQVIGQVFMDDQAQIGIGVRQGREQPGQQIGTKRRDDAEVQRSGQRPGLLPRQRYDRVGLGQYPACLGDDLRADLRDVHRLVRALEQGDAQERLELPELRAQGRLADMAGFRRPAEMAEVRERDEIAKLTQGHASKR